MMDTVQRGMGWKGAAVAMLCAGAAVASDLSNNLSVTSGGSEAGTAIRQLAANFNAGADDHVLTSVTLLLGNPVMGDATVAVYADGGLEPGDLIATLASPAEYSSDLAETTFSAPSVPLEAGKTYWIVLTTESGEFAWGWANDTIGDGEGFSGEWGVAVPDEDDEFGWWTQDIYPLQMAVGVDESCAADFNGDGSANTQDVLAFLNAWVAGEDSADINEDGSVNTLDVLAFLNLWAAGC